MKNNATTQTAPASQNRGPSLASIVGRKVQLENDAHHQLVDGHVEIGVSGVLEDHEEGQWYVRIRDDEFGSCGVGFTAKHVLEIDKLYGGAFRIILK